MKKVQKIELLCEGCRNTFFVYPCVLRQSKRNYCSRECKSKSFIVEPRECVFCDEMFTPTRSNLSNGGGRFCSVGCYNKSKIILLEVECYTCGITILGRPSYLNRSKNNFCSKACEAQSYRNGYTVLCKTCGKPFEITPCLTKGNHAGLYCSKECYANDESSNRKRGEDHPLWKGGISSARNKIKGTPAWRNAVKNVISRDKCCRLCASKGILNKEERNIHHIETFVEAFLLACDPGNLIWLCRTHHNRIRGKEKRWMKKLLTLISVPMDKDYLSKLISIGSDSEKLTSAG